MMLHTVVGEHVVELYDEVIVSVKPLKADVRCGIDIREVLVQLHLWTFIVIILVSFLIILERESSSNIGSFKDEQEYKIVYLT